MFKLEVDGGRPACRVHGSGGRRYVRSTVSVSRSTWYAATCSRVGSTLSVTVRPYGGTTSTTTTTSGATGTLSFAASRPASVGGKLTPGGAVVAEASDQFNGAVSQVWVSGP